MLNFLEQILEKKPFNFDLTRSSQRDFTAKKLKKEEYMRSPFFYCVFYTIVFTGFVYFTLVETLDSTLQTIHYVVYTSWTSCFLHTFA